MKSDQHTGNALQRFFITILIVVAFALLAVLSGGGKTFIKWLVHKEAPRQLPK